MSDFGWLAVLRGVFEIEDEGVPDALRKLDGVSALGWVLSVEIGTEQLEELEDLVDAPGGERLYHAAVALTTAPPHAATQTFSDAGHTAPAGHKNARFLIKLRDYAAKGEKDRLWFFDDGKVYSIGAKGKVVREVEDPDTFARALAAALP